MSGTALGPAGSAPSDIGAVQVLATTSKTFPVEQPATSSTNLLRSSGPRSKLLSAVPGRLDRMRHGSTTSGLRQGLRGFAGGDQTLPVRPQLCRNDNESGLDGGAHRVGLHQPAVVGDVDLDGLSARDGSG